MSLLNVYLGPAHVDVYVDTLSGEIAGAPGDAARLLSQGEICKLCLLADSNVILAGNGMQLFFGGLLYGAFGRYGNGFDGLVADMPALLQRSMMHSREVVARMGYSVECLNEQLIALAGYSAREGRMCAKFWMHDPEAGAWEAFDLEPGSRWISPWSDAWGSLPMVGRLPPADAAMVAADQVARITAESAGAPIIGGRLLHAHLTADQARVSEICGL